MYVLSPKAVEPVPKSSLFDMPMLFEEPIVPGRRTNRCTVRGYWLDIGHMSDYQPVNDDFSEIFE